jgi:hypothetical protein
MTLTRTKVAENIGYLAECLRDDGVKTLMADGGPFTEQPVDAVYRDVRRCVFCAERSKVMSLGIVAAEGDKSIALGDTKEGHLRAIDALWAYAPSTTACAARNRSGGARSYISRHATALQEDIGEALADKAQKLAEHAREAAALYAAIEDGKQELRRLTPPEPVEENTSDPASVTTVLGPVRTGTLTGGPQRGEVKQVLAHLQGLPEVAQPPWSREPIPVLGSASASSATETVIGPVPGEEHNGRGKG